MGSDARSGSDLGARSDLGAATDLGAAADSGVAEDAGEPLDGASGCASATTCSDCTAMSACGFCPGLGCMEGTSSGPTIGGDAGTCEGWSWVRSSCPDYDAGPGFDSGPPPSCAAATTDACGPCTAQPYCGYCPALGCVTGGSSGPSEGTCADWSYYPSECPGADAGVALDAGAFTPDTSVPAPA
ncbi:MAG: hypothetical protein IPK60_17895 [Sandaracinaceae bacterium]|nr:hypothetical protein [Sandaracinaceae bacterium]